MNGRFVLSLAVVIALVACDETEAATGPGTPAQACAGLANVIITQEAKCYGDLAPDQDTTTAVVSGGCVANFALNGTGYEPAVINVCAGGYDELDCDQFIRGDVPDACKITGTLPEGVACNDDSQCTSGFCPATGCGLCSRAPKEDEACVNGLCPSGLVCVASVCTTAGTEGDPCANGRPCQFPLACKSPPSATSDDQSDDASSDDTSSFETASCATLEVGDACDQPGGLCTLDGPLGCGANGACAAFTIARVGQPCGGDVKALCDGASRCSAATNGTCTAVKHVGDACVTEADCGELSCVKSACAVASAPACN